MKNVWWSQVTNAVQYIEDIKQCLLAEKSVFIKYSCSMPWRGVFEEELMESVKIENAEKKFVSVHDVSEPGEYLLNEFCKKEKRAEYRPNKGHAKFLAESDDIVLHDRYLWITAADSATADRWSMFISDYLKERGKKRNKAVFILEGAESTGVSAKKGLKVFSFDDYVGEYDRIVFAYLASSGIHENILLKNYVAELVSNVTGNDIELCEKCIQNYKFFLDNPESCINRIVHEAVRSDGSKYIFEKDAEEVNHLIWLSQIKTIYPYLEEYREDFVKRHSSAIMKQLPIQTSYGETCNDPKEVELGALMFMAGQGLLGLSMAEYEKLKAFKEARNTLSHLGILDINQIRGLL